MCRAVVLFYIVLQVKLSRSLPQQTFTASNDQHCWFTSKHILGSFEPNIAPKEATNEVVKDDLNVVRIRADGGDL